MKVEQVEPNLEALDGLFGYEAHCCFVLEDERPLAGATGFLDWRMCGALSRVLQQGFFKGTPGERLLVPTDGRVQAGKIFAVGLGRASSVTALGLEHALSAAATMLERAQVQSVALSFPALPPAVGSLVPELVARAFVPAFDGRVAIFPAPAPLTLRR